MEKMNGEEYFRELEDKVHVAYSVAEEARKKGLDPKSVVEVPLATSLAGKVTGLISTVYPQLNNPQLVNRILDLEKEYGALDPAVCLKIAEEIAKEKFCKFESHLQAVDAGIRIGMAYITLGVVSSPIEGFTHLKLKKTRDGKDYFAAYYSGPIRSAGGTGAAFSLVIIDYLREIFGYAKFDPDEKEVKRFVTELYDYHERVTNLQYLPTEDEILFLAKNVPIQIDGDASEDREVSNYKDLPRVETNMIRSGVCLTLGEGLAQKAPKIARYVKKLREKGFKLSDWDFLEGYNELHKKRESGKASESPTYIHDLVAGRPVLGHPSASGAFRLRYGRARSTGYSCLAIHPSLTHILDGFIATGTQLKIELPTKGTAVSICDSIEAPIVKLRNGSVKKVKDVEEAKTIYKDVEEILYLGDLLIPYGDFANRNHVLEPAGYTEEQWGLELRKANFQEDRVKNVYGVDFETSFEISKKYGIGLHPSWTFFWSQIKYEDFIALLDWISRARIIGGKMILPYNKTEQERFKKGKRALELLGVEHGISTENVILENGNSKGVLVSLGINPEIIEDNSDNVLEKEIVEYFRKIKHSDNVLELVNMFSLVKINDKAGTFIGSRMGRPEKAKLRKLVGSPNVLFPVGEEGGRMRSVNEAVLGGSVKSDFPIYYCEKCSKETIYFMCENCGSECKKMNYCPECGNKFYFEKCPEHIKGNRYMPKKIDSKHYFDCAIKKIGMVGEEIPALVKGVKGTSNANHVPENLAKGLLRSLFKLNVNKDGTIRYDATELPITHFKPREVSVSVEKLKSIGYLKDKDGKELENEEQVLEIFPHDIILPCCPETLDEKADDVFVNIARFIDSLLLRFYGTKPYYNVKSRDDLVGHLVCCIAPHNCAGVVARIIGFSKTQGLLASPYMHAAMRRDCVAPETKIFFYDEDTREIFYDEIGRIVEKLIADGARMKKIDAFGTLQVENTRNLFAFGVDSRTHELKKKRIKYFIKGPETKEWIKVTTATNREYIMTPTHKFMYSEDGEFKFKEGKDAQEGDRIPVLENFNFELHREDIDLIKLFREKLSQEEQREILVINNGSESELLSFNEKDYGAAEIRHKFSHYRLPAILKIDGELMRILGYYASEGYSRQNKSVSQVAFRICNREMQEHLVEIIKKKFGIDANLGEDNSKITICSKIIYYLFRCVETGEGAYEKRVPGFVFGLNKDLVREYISAYFEGDGSIIKQTGRVVFYSVSRGLLDDVALLLSKFRIFARYFRTEMRLPGKKVLERYEELGKEPRKHILNHLVLGRKDSFELGKILNLVNRDKAERLIFLKPIETRSLRYNHKQILLNAQSDYVLDYVKRVEIVKREANSYCVEIDWKEIEDRNILWGEQVINTRCDGDEAAIMLLLDLLLNFSREFLPAHRGGTQDAPLVLNARIRAGEVDDMIFDIDVVREYPLSLYEAASRHEHPSKIKIEQIKNRVGNNEFLGLDYTHDTRDINAGVMCSNYKRLPNMKEKVNREMELVEKIRAADTTDVARLIIERHFIRDIRGNLRKFSQQEFRCTKCNEKYRRPPLTGACLKCGGNIIFTISEGSIIKYLEPALGLARKYKVPPYVLQNLELTRRYIESIFGREKEKQAELEKWF